ncbi:hypothetical protein AB1388_12580 [Streptomyces hydrogenans]|uniref:hypothetical protein n=1 Tax=Streptomyces hydrogenans TaxID=1873719 RepID=UPI003442F3DC
MERHRIGHVGERRDAGHGGEVSTDLVHVGLILAQFRRGVVQREAPPVVVTGPHLTEHGARQPGTGQAPQAEWNALVTGSNQLP